jgi:preprotein translocase subunit SecD
MRSIIDANVTHVLTGAILLIFGTGPIQGFATTLLIGISNFFIYFYLHCSEYLLIGDIKQTEV